MNETNRNLSEPKTYTPGYRIPKFIGVLLGIALMLVGGMWIKHPLSLVLNGKPAEGTIANIIQQYPEQEPETITSNREIRQINDFTRTAVFKYTVRFEAEDGTVLEGLLNYGQVLRPLHTIGEKVQIAYNPENPSELIRTWDVRRIGKLKFYLLDLRTWSFGIFFLIIGFLIALTQGILLYFANKPIVIDSIQDLDVRAEMKR